jgi:hypothetical protein
MRGGKTCKMANFDDDVKADKPRSLTPGDIFSTPREVLKDFGIVIGPWGELFVVDERRFMRALLSWESEIAPLF